MIQAYNEEVSLVTNSETPYIKFHAFDEYKNVKSFFSTRLGGVSKGHLFSLNLGYNLGDDKENVDENYRRLAKAVNISELDFVAPKQVHELDVFKVGNANKGNGIYADNIYESADGLVTNEKNVYLTVYGADCCGLLFYDTVNNAIGTAHAGWKGTVGDISSVVIDKMKAEFNTDPKDLVVEIAPSICVGCYEVGPEVAAAFQAKYPSAYDKQYVVSNLFKGNTILEHGEADRSYVNLWLANYVNLISKGVNSAHIHVSGLCTKCHSDLLYSHRATGGKRGVQAGFIGLI